MAAAASPGPAPLVGLDVAARYAGRAKATFIKVWPSWVKKRGFPAPVTPAKPYLWREASLRAWQDRAEAENAMTLCAEADAPPVSNDNRGGLPGKRAVDRGRALIAARMGGLG